MTALRILYLSCHSILEHDEIKLFNELGHYVFSPGAYVEPANPGNASLRPGLSEIVYNEEDKQAWSKLQNEVGHDKDPKYQLSKEFVDRFDVVIVMHIPDWVALNWEAMKHKKVILRTIGQNIAPQEKFLAKYKAQGLKIVRYSPMEKNIPFYCGEDAMIRFYKDPEEYKDWNGEQKRVITFAQHMERRDQACNFTYFKGVTKDFARGLYGPGNENSGDFCHGQQEYSTLKQLMKDSRVYFYTGTHPASYTLNFIEALMTGIPVVAIGFDKGNAKYFAGHNLYEIPDIIKHGVNGFISDDPSELKKSIQLLLEDKELADRISKAGRETAIELFGVDSVKALWSEFFKSL